MDTRPPKPDSDHGPLTRMGLPMPFYNHAIAPIWDRVSVYDGATVFLQQLAAVTAEQGLLWAAHFCESEICNGGFHQFFSNPTGVLAPEAVRGFELIELPEAAAVIRQAFAMFGREYPRDQDERVAALKGLERKGASRAEWDPFHAQDEMFYAVTGTRDFGEQADGFVRSHMSLFFR